MRTNERSVGCASPRDFRHAEIVVVADAVTGHRTHRVAEQVHAFPTKRLVARQDTDSRQSLRGRAAPEPHLASCWRGHLDQVAARVVEDGRGDWPHLGRILREPDAETLKSFELGSHVLNCE